ncbi:MAG: PKD domain-containing protein [Bacteroidetes bacterium]|nr:PKD domain-containing protein [Bacteroidota bacterium]
MKNKIAILFILISCTFQTQAHKLNCEFIENQGQWNAPFIYKGVTSGGNFFLRKDGIRISMSDVTNQLGVHVASHDKSAPSKILKYHAYDIEFVNPSKDVLITGSKSAKHYYNYFIGKNETAWKTGIHPNFNLDYSNIFENIDAHFYFDNENLKYDFILQPNANANLIKLKYNGLEDIQITEGNLLLQTSLGIVKEIKPYCYQFIDGEKKEIPSKYILKDNTVSFAFPKGYNRNYTLIIDPAIVFCSFSGSTADNWGMTATYDTTGNFYAGGVVVNDQPGFSTVLTGNYPVTLGAIQFNYGGGNNPGPGSGIVPTDCSFSKFDPSGANLIYATYFGGLDNEQPHSMIVDYDGNLVITGRTFSSEASFPLSVGCYDNTYNGGGDMFIAKFNPLGTVLLGSTYVGGSGEESANIYLSELLIGGLKHNYADDARSEVIVDLNNNIYVTSSTKSTNFPTVNPTQAVLGGLQDAIVIQLSSNLNTLIWSTYLGGSLNDAGYVLALNKSNPNELYIAGGTESSNFPTTGGTLNPAYVGGSADGFLLKFNTISKLLLAGTFIGTNQYDQVYGVQTDDSNRVYIVGQTMGAYPTTPGVFITPNSSQFISIINNNLSTYIASTVFGKGSTVETDIAINAFLVDKCQNVYVSGWGGPIIGGNPGNTTGLLTSVGALQATTDGSDFYFYVLSKNLVNFIYGSFFGQNGGGGEHVDGGTSRFDANGVIYQAICSACGGGTQNFPVTPGAYSTSKLQTTNCNFGALKIAFDFQNPSAQAAANGPLTGCVPLTITFQNNSTSATAYQWDFGDGSPFDNSLNPTHTYTTAGIYTLTLIASNPNGCTASADTTQLIITVRNDSMFPGVTFMKVDSCGPFTVQFNNTSTYNNGIPAATATYTWDFGDGTSYTGQFPPLHNYPTAATYTVTLTMTDPNACNNPATTQVIIDFSTSLVIAAFIMPDTICLPAVVTFNDQSTNATSWNWVFGDGNTANVQNPTNTYSTIGTYTVYLVSGNPNTCNKFDSASKVITILPTPVADFTWTPNPPEPNTPNNFKNLSVGATKYLWDFGDGTTSTNKDDVHVYDKDGTYTVCLTATNEYGCRDTVCKSVRGIVVPLVDVPSGFSPNGDGINDMVYVKGYGIEKMTFRIFNRWGEKVFESTEKTKGWDGRYKNVMQEMEVYAYTLSVEFFDGTKTSKNGNITLLK